MPVAVKSKNGMIEIFETLSRFPNQVMMLKNGDNIVDAHSLIGFFTIDETKPIEIIFDSEPNEEIKEAVSKFAPQA